MWLILILRQTASCCRIFREFVNFSGICGVTLRQFRILAYNRPLPRFGRNDAILASRRAARLLLVLASKSVPPRGRNRNHPTTVNLYPPRKPIARREVMHSYRIVWEDEAKAREVELFVHYRLDAGVVSIDA